MLFEQQMNEWTLSLFLILSDAPENMKLISF